MICTPVKGLKYSVEKHNCRIDVIADWIEGSALFESNRVSRSGVIDFLMSEQLYRNEDFAEEFVSIVWKELKYRLKYGKINALSLDSKGVERNDSWEMFPAYSFCLTLSLNDWCSRAESSYVVQGDLFERLTECSLRARGWRSLRTGWVPTRKVKLFDLIQQISSHLNQPIGNQITQWVSSSNKDAGLDLICDLPFLDSRGGHPIYFFQCASGVHWNEKVATPNLQIWEKLIDFSNSPVRGFSLPYVLNPHDFRSLSNRVNGILVDRLRLIGLPDGIDEWVDNDLQSDLIRWLSPRLDVLMS